MAAILIDPDSALRVPLEHNTFSSTKIAAHPLTANLAPEYDAFQVKWFQVQTKEILLWIDMLKAAARIVVADDALDTLIDRISNAILVITDNDREAALYVFYFNGRTPSDCRKPVLGNQLAQMRAWTPSLKSSPHASLQALGAELEQAVANADQAVADLALAKTANREFRTVGERRALIDEFNAMQKRNAGKIAEIPHTEAGKHLPNTFHEGFFKKSSRPTSTEDEEKTWTSADFLVAIAESEGRTEELKAKLSEAIATEKAQEAKKATREAKKAARDEKALALKKAQDELAAAEKDLSDE